MKREQFAEVNHKAHIQYKSVKEQVTCTVSLHWVAARIMKGIQNGTIDLSKDSLRVIASKISDKELMVDSPQIIKHHLGTLTKLGALQIIGGTYKLK